jgi:hypothetical protein
LSAVKLSVGDTTCNGATPAGVDAMVVNRALAIVSERLDRIPESEVEPIGLLAVQVGLLPDLGVEERAAAVADELLVAIELKLLGKAGEKRSGVADRARRWWATVTGGGSQDPRRAKLDALAARVKALDAPSKKKLYRRIRFELLACPALHQYLEGQVALDFLLDGLGDLEVDRFVAATGNDRASLLGRVAFAIDHLGEPDPAGALDRSTVEAQWTDRLDELWRFAPKRADAYRSFGTNTADQVAADLNYYHAVEAGLEEARTILGSLALPAWLLQARSPGDAHVLEFLAGKEQATDTIAALGIAPAEYQRGRRPDKDPAMTAIERTILYARLLERRATLSRATARSTQQAVELRAVHGALELLATGTVGAEFNTGTNSTIFEGLERTQGKLLSKAELQRRAVVTGAGEGARMGGKAADPDISIARGQEGLGTAWAYARMNSASHGYLTPAALSDAELEARVARTKNALAAMAGAAAGGKTGGMRSDAVGIPFQGDKSHAIYKDDLESDLRDCLGEKARRENEPTAERPYPVVLSMDVAERTRSVGRKGAGTFLAGEARVEGSIDLASSLEFVFVPQDRVAAARTKLARLLPGRNVHVLSFEALDLIAGLSVERALVETYAVSYGGLTRSAYTQRFLAERAQAANIFFSPDEVAPLWNDTDVWDI